MSQDPAELQRQIAALQAQLAEALQKAPAGNATASDGSIAITIGGSVFGNVTVHTGTGPSPRSLLAHYLKVLIADCQKLKLDVIDEKNTVDSAAQLRLGAVYTNLLVTAADETRAGSPEEMMQRERKALSAAAFASRHACAVILGRPGAGKTTFTDFLCLCIAGQLTQNAEVNLTLLGEDWQAGTLLPLRITLREYAALSLPQELSLWDHLKKDWKGALEGFADPVRKHLLEQGGLLVLDGLDEVPEASGCREKVKAAILKFQRDFPNVRLLVTSRTYAYLHQQWRLPGFESAELAAFEQEQWDAFIDKWYTELAGIRRNFSAEAAQHRAGELKLAIGDRPHLQELAASPLLLTLMASLHALRGGTLPRERELLYNDSVSLLLDAWERPKTVYQDGKPVIISASAQEFMKLTARADLEKAISRLAYEVHAEQGHKTGVADITEGALLGALGRIAQGLNPVLLAESVRDRAGLLTHHGEGVYRFPHRTFQEYMAARHLGDLGPEEIARHLREDAGRWREAYLLAGAKTARGAAWAAWAIVRKTCPDVPNKKAKDAEWLCASLAAQLIVEVGLMPADADDGKTRQTIVDALVKLIIAEKLEPLERARAGVALGHLGDPRPGVTTREPDWVMIPAGSFQYGDKKETRQITQPYQISRHLVTVAQYARFIAAGGYEDPELRKAGFTAPETYRPVFQTPNHPQVGVSKIEADAFCRWLSKELGKCVRLPTEEEWERAARGTDGREFPWGASEDAACHANVENTIGHTSAVGLFSSGASPAGCLDMAGNVWEWTGSLYQQGEHACVLRGGAFLSDAVCARCASRVRPHPHGRGNVVGFRVVVSPF